MKTVSIRECNDYIYEDIKTSFNKMIEDIGGLEKYIKRGSKVLIKLNLLMKKRPEEATTTHPLVLKALAEELLKLDCEVIVGDSPGGPYTERILNGIYKACGIEEIANELNIKLNYDISEAKVENKEGKILKYLTVIKPVEDVDHVISLCKLKTHVMATYTGGVKNLFGVIPGMAKAEYHFKMPDLKDFTDALVDICEYVKPTLTIMDGIIGMEGEGPSAGIPRKVGLLIGSSNPYALDVVGCKIINLDPKTVPTVQRSLERKLLKEDFSDIIIVGEKLEDKIIKDYRIPKNRNINFFKGKMPKILEQYVTLFFTPKPAIRYKDCVKCGECARVCPAKTIDMNDKGPDINLNSCIRCYCCHELCPKKAIDIKRPFVFRYIK